MDLLFDLQKSERNEFERGLPFERVEDFDFTTAIHIKDDRFENGEDRWLAIGHLDQRLHVICFVEVPERIRIISFRKANAREGRKYGSPQTLD
jgi:uncharacterized DUF497 family protein